jgi:hypothetical protein
MYRLLRLYKDEERPREAPSDWKLIRRAVLWGPNGPLLHLLRLRLFHLFLLLDFAQIG